MPTVKTTAAGQVITDKNPFANNETWPDEMKAKAQVMWETDLDMTHRKVGDELGIPWKTIERWSKTEKWQKVAANNFADRAEKIADTYVGNLEKYGPEITTEQRNQAVAETTDKIAADLRADVVDRHRREWQAPRQISYEAIKERNFEKAKLAKITAETLMLIQNGERRAWGMDKTDKPGEGENTIVVVERE